jgi:long-chain acyl-CoA synthetase
MHQVTQDDLPLSRLYHWEQERAERIFLTQPLAGGKVRDWTWGQVGDEVRRMAAYLKAQDWEPESRVAILSRNCAWWIMADLAIWMAGHVSVPVYPSLNCRTVRYILEHCGAKGCFLGATDEKEMTACGLPPGVYCIGFPTAPAAAHPAWDEVTAATPPLRGNPLRGGDDLSTLIYTSGTTGTPKGVMHRFAAFSYVAKAASDLLGLTAEERLFSYLPLAHIIERCACEALGLFLGFHIFFSAGMETFLADLKLARPTIFPSVPRLLAKFQQGVFEKVPRRRLDRLLRIPLVNRAVKKRVLRGLGLQDARYAASGGAALPVEILLWYRNLGLQLFEGYGMTETAITHLPPSPDQIRPGYVGSAIDGVEQKLGSDGELLLKSPMTMVGYYNDPQGTRDGFTPDGFFRTGDLVQLDSDGQVRIIGRVKEQFKTSKGKYVAPAPIETRLMTHPAVEACCVMGVDLPRPFAVVLLSPEAKQSALREGQEALEQSLLERMNEVNAMADPHERLGFIAIADGPWTIGNEFLTPTLKIKRATLERRYLAMAVSWEERHTPVLWESGLPDPGHEPTQPPVENTS